MLVEQRTAERPLGRSFAKHRVALRPKNSSPVRRHVTDREMQVRGRATGPGIDPFELADRVLELVTEKESA